MLHLTAEVAVHTYPFVGEGPVWCTDTQCLYYVDAAPGKIHYFDPQKHTDIAYDLPALLPGVFTKVTALALCQGVRNQVIVATESGIFHFDRENVTLKKLTDQLQPNLAQGSYCTNDGKCDPRGRFLIGTMLFPPDAPAGGLFSMEKDGDQYHVKQLLDGVTISNGLAWSGDGRVMYYIDSPLKKVEAWDYNLDSGDISNRRTAFDFQPYFADQGWSDAVPDGMTIDVDGMLWVAIYNAGCVLQVDPNKNEVIGRVDCATKCTTCPTFGGADLDTLYITTIRIDDPNPLAGAVFRCKVPVRGLPPTAFGN